MRLDVVATWPMKSKVVAGHKAPGLTTIWTADRRRGAKRVGRKELVSRQSKTKDVLSWVLPG